MRKDAGRSTLLKKEMTLINMLPGSPLPTVKLSSFFIFPTECLAWVYNFRPETFSTELLSRANVK